MLSIGSLGVDLVIDGRTAERTSTLVNDSLRSIALADDLRAQAYRLSAGPDPTQLAAIARQIDADARAFDPIATSAGERDEWNHLQDLLAHLRHDPGTVEPIPAITKSIAHLVEINETTARADAAAIGDLHDRGLWVDVGVGLATLALAVVVAFALVRNLRMQRTQTAAHVAELEAFAGRTAHDLRGPLSPVRGYADILQLDERDAVRGYGQKIRKATDRMDGIIDDLLALSVSGKPRPGAAPVRPTIDAVLAELAITDADVALETDDSIAAVSAGVLAQLLRNVIGNASKYRAERRLKLRITCAKGAIAIADNGIGMSADAAKQAFDPYFRADTALPGHGLGLAIVRRTVEACGGSCELSSTLGEGTTVTLRLPLQGRPPA